MDTTRCPRAAPDSRGTRRAPLLLPLGSARAHWGFSVRVGQWVIFVVRDYSKLFGKALPGIGDLIDVTLDDVARPQKAVRCGFFFFKFSERTCARISAATEIIGPK